MSKDGEFQPRAIADYSNGRVLCLWDPRHDQYYVRVAESQKGRWYSDASEAYRALMKLRLQGYRTNRVDQLRALAKEA